MLLRTADDAEGITKDKELLDTKPLQKTGRRTLTFTDPPTTNYKQPNSTTLEPLNTTLCSSAALFASSLVWLRLRADHGGLAAMQPIALTQVIMGTTITRAGKICGNSVKQDLLLVLAFCIVEKLLSVEYPLNATAAV